MLKSMPATLGVMGSIPDLGRSHVPRSSQTRAPRLLSLSTLEPELRSGRSLLSTEKGPRRSEDPAQINHRETPPTQRA